MRASAHQRHALSVGLPAHLLQNRPDIRRAERDLEAAGLDVKVARAHFFPRLDINAGVAYEAAVPVSGDNSYMFPAGTYEIRLALEERASLSPDALTAMEANLRFPGAETAETKIFGRLSAWQNWVFYRPNSTGETGALKLFGSGTKPRFDQERV